MEIINIGLQANDGTGDALRVAFNKVNKTIGRVRPLGINISSLGDSHTVGGFGPSSSFYNQLLFRSKGRFNSVGKFGVAGERSDQMLARLESVINVAPHACFIQLGTNDISQGVTRAVIRANTQLIISGLLDKGITPIFVGLFPNNGSSSNRLKHQQVDMMIAQECADYGVPFIHVYDELSNPDGTWATVSPAYNADNLHASSSGALKIADIILAALPANTFARKFPIAASADTTIANAFNFTDSNADGIPDSWTKPSGTGTTSIRSATGDEWGSWLRITSTDTSYTTVQQFMTLPGSWIAGHRIAFACNAKWEDTSGVTVIIEITYNGSSGVAYTRAIDTWTGSNDGMAYFEADIPTGTTALITKLSVKGQGYAEINRPTFINLSVEPF